MTGEPLRRWGTRLFYGLGKTPDIIKLLSFDTFILFYYSQVLGLPGTLAGLTIFLVVCADATWAPIVGNFSDRLKSARFGRRITPMVYAALPGSLAFYLMFSPPHGLSTPALFAWMLGSAMFLRCTMSFYEIPYYSLQAELADAQSDRASLVIFASLFRMVAEFLIIAFAFRYFFHATPQFANGQQNPDAYPYFGLAFGATMGALMLICTASLYPSIRRMRSYRISAHKHAASIFSLALWRSLLVQNRSFRALVGGNFTFAIATGINTALQLYLGTYLFHLTSPEIAHWRQAINVGSFLSLIFLVNFLLRRFEVKPIFVFSMTAAAVAELSVVVLFLLHALPTTIAVIWFLLAANFIHGFINGSNMITPTLLICMSADDHEYRTHAPQQGLMFGLVHFGQKAGTGVGSLIAGVFLDLVKFPKGAPVEAVTRAMIDPIAWFYVVGLVVSSIAGILVYRGFKIRNADHDLVLTALNGRRADGGANEPRGQHSNLSVGPKESIA